MGDDIIISACTSTTDTVRVRVHAAHDAAGSRRHRRPSQHVPMRDCEQDEQQSDGEPAAPRPPLHSSANTYLRSCCCSVYIPGTVVDDSSFPVKSKSAGAASQKARFVKVSRGADEVTRGRSPLISRGCHHFQASTSISSRRHSIPRTTAASVSVNSIPPIHA